MLETIENIIVTYNVVIFTVAFFGNLTTVIVIALFRELQSTTNFYILNLAIADLLMCVTTTPARMIFLFKGGLFTCRVNTFMWIFFFSASVFAIFFIAIDRYVFICRPLYYRSHCVSTKIKYWISVSWVLALLLAILPFVGVPHLSKQRDSHQPNFCAHRVVVEDWYLIFLDILTEILPPFLFCPLYGKIITIARKHAVEIAIQFSNSRPMSMDWLERRRFTESLVSPFENPTCLLEATGTDGDELQKLRTILYRNYDSWKQKVREEVRHRTESSHSGGGTQEADQSDDLSQVGKSLREWRRRATGITDCSIMEGWEQADKDVIEKEGRANRRRRNRVGPTKSDGEVVERKRRLTEQGRSGNVSRPQLRRFLSLGIVPGMTKKGKTNQGSEGQDGQSEMKAQNGGGPFLIQSLSKFSVAVHKRKKIGSGKLKIYKEFKAVKMLGIVVGMFVLLHVPIALIDLIDLLAKDPIVPLWVVTVALQLTRSSPAVNPMIYVVTKREFRHAFVRLWSCGRIKKRPAQC